MPDENISDRSGDVLKSAVLAREKFKDELHRLDKEIAQAKLKPSQDIAADTARTGKVNRDQAVQKFNSWKAENDRLTAQKAAVQHFSAINDKQIADADPDSIVPILDDLIASLRQTYSEEKSEADALSKRLEELEAEKAEKMKRPRAQRGKGIYAE
jgi:hypothetical protein